MAVILDTNDKIKKCALVLCVLIKKKARFSDSYLIVTSLSRIGWLVRSAGSINGQKKALLSL